MHDLRTLAFACLTLWSFIPQSYAVAQESSAVDSRIAATAPFVDGNTFCIVHLDLKQIDLKVAAERFLTLAPESAKDMLPTVRIFAAQGEQIRKQVVAAGVSDLYVIGTLSTGSEEPEFFAVAEVEKGKDPEAAKGVLAEIPGTTEENFFIHKGYVIGGLPKTKATLASLQPAAHPALADAFRYAGKTALQIVFLPSTKLLEAAKKSAEPGLAAPLSSADERLDELKALVITANLPPKPALAIFGHAKDEASAKAAVDELTKALDGDAAKNALAMPALAKLAPFLRPAQDGPRIKLLFTEKNGGIEALANAVKMGIEMAGPAMAQGGFPGGPPGPPLGP